MCFDEQTNLGGITVTFVGGDRRQVYAAEILRRRGFAVTLWGLGQEARPKTWGQYVILPIPGMDDAGRVKPFSGQDFFCDAKWLAELAAGTVLLSGRFAPAVAAKAEASGVRCIAYLADDAYQRANAIPTAEGAICLAMTELDTTISGAQALVLGYGRCGEALALRLDKLGANVTVAARSATARALAEAQGLRAVDLTALDGADDCLRQYGIVYNTIPALVLNEARLARLGAKPLIIDIASAPGGIDYPAAQGLGLRAILAGNLPGRHFPQSAGQILAEHLQTIILKQHFLSQQTR